MSKLEPIAISVSQAAEVLGVSRPTLYRLLRQADFPSLRIGGRVLVSKSGLEEWVLRQTEVRG